MAKEIRAGWYVVGTLLVMFCTVVWIRFASRTGNTSDIWVSLPLVEESEHFGALTESGRLPQVRFHPTIVKSSTWEVGELSSGGAVRPASAILDDAGTARRGSEPIRVEGDAPNPVPSDMLSELVNPREVQPRPIPRHAASDHPFAPFSSARK
jgi:hypothetical protein